MRQIIAIALSLSLLLLQGGAFGSEEDSVRSFFSSYWKDFRSGDWMAAAEYMHPDDLVEVHKYILPIFLEVAEKKTDKQSRLWVTGFFGDTAPDKRATMTPKDVYVALNRFVFSDKAVAFAAYKTAKMEIAEVQSSGDDFIVHYTIALTEDNVVADSERVTKKDGKWRLRTKLSMPEFAPRFRKSFGL
jgi:hypothetical protein